MFIWLVVWTPLKNISQLGWLFQNMEKNEKKQTTNQSFLLQWENHQPVEGRGYDWCLRHPAWKPFYVSSSVGVGSTPTGGENTKHIGRIMVIDQSMRTLWMYSPKKLPYEQCSKPFVSQLYWFANQLWIPRMDYNSINIGYYNILQPQTSHQPTGVDRSHCSNTVTLWIILGGSSQL